MKKVVVTESISSNSEGLYSSLYGEVWAEFHQRILLCWFYSILFIIFCLKGDNIRLIFNPKPVNIDNNTNKNVIAIKGNNVEILWSNTNFAYRLILAPIYGIYIIILTIIGKPIYIIRSEKFLNKNEL